MFENRVEKYCNRQMQKRYETTQEDAEITLSKSIISAKIFIYFLNSKRLNAKFRQNIALFYREFKFFLVAVNSNNQTHKSLLFEHIL